MARANGNMSRESRVRAVERQRAVLELRKTGMHFHDIAARTGFRGASGAYEAFKKALRATVQQPADEVRRLEVERLDALLAAVWPDAIAGKVDAVDRVLRIMDRRAALLGLDAPTRSDFTAVIRLDAERAGLDPDEAVRIAEQVLRESRT